MSWGGCCLVIDTADDEFECQDIHNEIGHKQAYSYEAVFGRGGHTQIKYKKNIGV